MNMVKDEKNEEGPKIIVDEDWKAEAQKEKEILAAQEEAEIAVEEKEEQKQRARGSVPPGNFAALVSTLATQAVYSMGLMSVEGQEQPEADLEIARFNIDMLATVEEKTKGNLSKEEAQVIKNTLSELRMTFVKLAGESEPKGE
jgi:hypothetical protein